MPPPPLPIITPAPGSPDPQPRVAPRLAAGEHAEERGAGIAARIGARVPVGGVLAVERHRRRDVHRRHVGGDAAREAGGVEGRDRPRAADAAGHGVPEHVPANAVGRDDADAGDDDARCGHAAGPKGAGVPIIRAGPPTSCRSPIAPRAPVWPWPGWEARRSWPRSASTSTSSWCGLPRRARRTWPLAAALAWNAGLFVVFAAHHSVMARAGAKAWLTRWLPAAYERSAYVWIASVLLVLVTLGWQRVPGLIYEATGPLAWALVAVQALGVVLTVAAARVLRATDLAGIRQARGLATAHRRPDRLAVHPGPAPDLSWLGADRAGRPHHDRRSRVVGAAEHRLPAHRHALGGA